MGASEIDKPANGRPRARRLSPSARRAQLLDVAVSVVAATGLEATRHHAGVAEKAAVSTATVFVYFPKRDDLVGAVLREVEQRLADLTEGIMLRDLPVGRNTLELLRAFSDWVDSHPDHARIWLEWGTAIRQDIWQRYLDAIDWYVDLWSTAIEKGMRQGEIGSGLAPDEMARLIVGSGQVIAQMKFARSDPETVDRYIRALVQAVIGTSDA